MQTNNSKNRNRLQVLHQHLFPQIQQQPLHATIQHQETAALLFDSTELRKSLYDSKTQYLRDAIFNLVKQEPDLFLIREQEFENVALARNVKNIYLPF